MEIRDATLSDLPRIVAIYNAAIPGRMATADLEPVTVESRLEWFHGHRSESHPLRVLEIHGVVAGWIGVQPFYGRCAYRTTVELSLYVAPEHRRKGVAQRLLRETIERGPALGLQALLGFIFGHNEPSLRLFEAEGFARWGRLPRVARLDDVWRDLVIVGRHL